MATLLELAQLSATSYGDPVNPPLNGNWILLESYTGVGNGYFGQAYQNRTTREIVITNRGTRFTSLDDALADIKLAAGVITREQEDAVKFARQVANNADYNYSSIIETGHSKGGNEAQAATIDLADRGFNVSAVTFNAPGIGGYPVGSGAYDVLNVYTQGDVIHLAGGAQLGRSMEIGAGPDNSKLSFALPIAAATGGGGMLLLFAKIVWNALVPAHSIDTIIDYLAGDPLGKTNWPLAGPPLALAGDTSNSWATVDTDGSFTLTDGAGDTFSYSTDPDGGQTYEIITQDAGSCTYTIASDGTTTETATTADGVSSTRVVDINGNTLTKSYDASGALVGSAWKDIDGSAGVITTDNSDYNSMVKESDGSVSYTYNSLGSNPTVGDFTTTIKADKTGSGTSHYANGAIANAWAINADGSENYSGTYEDGSLAYRWAVNTDKTVTFTLHDTDGTISTGIENPNGMRSGTTYLPNGSWRTWASNTSGTQILRNYAPDGRLESENISSTPEYPNYPTKKVHHYSDGGFAFIYPLYSHSYFTISYFADGSLSGISNSWTDHRNWTEWSTEIKFSVDGKLKSASNRNYTNWESNGWFQGGWYQDNWYENKQMELSLSTHYGLIDYTPYSSYYGSPNGVLDGGLTRTRLPNGDGSYRSAVYRSDGSIFYTTTDNADGSAITARNGTFLGDDGTVTVSHSSGVTQSLLTSEEHYYSDGSYIESAYSADGSHTDIHYDEYGVPTTTTIVNSNGDINQTGSESNDSLSGGAGADTLTGGAGNDTLDGGDGGDTYAFNAGDGVDTIQDSGATGSDTLAFGQGITTDSLSLGLGSLLIKVGTGNDAIHIKNFNPNNVYDSPNIENFKFADGTVLTYNQLVARGFDIKGSDSNDTLTGTNVVDRLYGFNGDDNLSGGDGNDALYGDAGNDTLRGDAGNDTLNGGDGNDFLWDPYYGDDMLIGGAGDDDLYAGGGDDTLLGGSGNDYLEGGYGNDTYLFNRGDGQDSISNWTSSNGQSDVILFGADVLPDDVAAIRVAGSNDLVLTIRGTGDRLTIINYFLNDGVSVYAIGAIQFANGTIWNYSTINAMLPGATDGDDTLYGNSSAEELNGLGGNDTIYGMGGVDTIAGGPGDDLLVGGFDRDIYLFNLGDGVDTIDDAVSYAHNGGYGGAYGGGGGNELRFGAGISPDQVAAIGEGGTLILAVSGTSDSIRLLHWVGGLDRVDTFVFKDGTVWNAAHVESMLTPNIAPQVSSPIVRYDATQGQGLAFRIPEGTFYDANPNDTLTLSVQLEDGNPLPTWLSFDMATQTFSGIPGSSEVGVYRIQVTARDPRGAQVIDVFDLTVAPADLTLIGTAGTDTLTGLSGNDTLDGRGGADTLTGGKGDDTYHVDNTKDKVVEGKDEGNDTVITSIDYSLPENVENITLSGKSGLKGTGNDLGNTLRGSSGKDTLSGGNGDDTYHVDSTKDKIVERKIEGMDTVVTGIDYTLPENVETLVLTGTAGRKGTGNKLDNILNGTVGNDNLDGDKGADTMTGGAGNDSYAVDNVDDRVIELADEGIDSVVSSVSYTLPDNVENLTLTGGKNNDDERDGDDHDHGDSDDSEDRSDGGHGLNSMRGTGNALANTIIGNAETNLLDGRDGNDILTGGKNKDTLYGGSGEDTLNGGSGDDLLDGGSGADTMTGGDGDDTFIIDDSADLVIEDKNNGKDSVVSIVSYTLTSNVENLTLAGTDAINAIGNTGNNVLTGNSGTNLLTAGAGNDTLDGSGGLDFLEGMAGNDTLADAAGSGYFNGGTGDDKLTGGASADFFLGGKGDDTIVTGGGNDVMVFNRGDGYDKVTVGANSSDTISLGGGIAYRDLKFKKRGNDLVLTTGDDEGIEFVNWYAGSANRNVLNLQLISEAMAGFDAGSADPLLSRKVQNFDFKSLAGAFDAARAAKSGLSSWALTGALTQFHLASSDSHALGGDLAYRYGKNGTLAGVGLAPAQSIIGDAQFGSQAQALQPLTGLQEGAVRLG